MLGYILLGVGAVIVVAVLFPAIRRPKLRIRDDTPVPVDSAGHPPATHGYARGTRRHAGRNHRKEQAYSPTEPKTCPVCRSTLKAGERIKSVVYRDGVQHGEITEYTTHVFGCPHCWPANGRNPRICPVCRGEINRDGHLIARMFERAGKKKHVRVLGCTACRTNRRIAR